ncbi:unnamed protein product [Ambrosiozyma monospora]|uniref:Unnamed protein product n=1 Tax=Ambrosiozyma monospora TaxID=43982 RepID=A0ACB5U8Y9_AMBMO|nr:unnamed protein product [Ambrosiozyma monospora]
MVFKVEYERPTTILSISPIRFSDNFGDSEKESVDSMEGKKIKTTRYNKNSSKKKAPKRRKEVKKKIKKTNRNVMNSPTIPSSADKETTHTETPSLPRTVNQPSKESENRQQFPDNFQL